MTVSSPNVTLADAASLTDTNATPTTPDLPFVWPGDALPEWQTVHLLPPAQDLRLPMMEACVHTGDHP